MSPDPQAPLDTRNDVWKLVLQTVGTIVGVMGGVSVAAFFFRDEIRVVARELVDRTGYVGMFLGSFLSDLVMFPVPPQFYMLTSIAAGAPQVPSVIAVCLGSVLAANLVYPLSGHISKIGFLRRRIEASRHKIDPLFARYGYWGVAIGAISPVPFSWLCYFAGIYRMPYRYYVLFVLFRVPRLLFYYVLIRLGWGH